MSLSSLHTHLGTAIALAHLLECVENGYASATAEGYCKLVLRLLAALCEDIPADALQAILDVYPAAGEVFENMHYERAGLSRASLERSVSTERLAKQVIARAARCARNA